MIVPQMMYQGGFSVAPGNNFSGVGNGQCVMNATESVYQTPYQTAGTFSRLYTRIVANDRGTSTISFRVAGASVNQALSVGASATGEFEDATQSDTITAGQLVGVLWNIGAGGSVFSPAMMRVLFNATADTIVKFFAVDNTTAGSAGTTFNAIGGDVANSTLVAPAQVQFRAAGTLKNYACNVRNNSWSAAATLGTQLNGSNGNLVVSVSSSSTGLFQDTSHTDSVSSGTLVNGRLTLAAGSGSFRAWYEACEFSCSGPTATQLVATGASNSGVVVTASQTQYYAPGWIVSNGAGTEANAQSKLGVNAVLSNLTVQVPTNTLTAASTFRTRVGGANGNQAVSVGSGATGVFEDSLDSDTVASSSEINYQLVTGGTGTSLTFFSITMRALGGLFGRSFLDGLSVSGPLQYQRAA